MKIDEFAKAVLMERYLWRDDDGIVRETPEEMCERVACAVANAENEDEKWSKIFYDMMINLDFIPNSPTLFNAGKDDGQLSACFVIPIEDSMESIFSTLHDMAMIQKTGGGTGMSFGKLRPQGSIVSSTHGVSSGPVSFMETYDAVSNAIKQGGLRRAANMGILPVDHPDIELFIGCKAEEGKLSNFNISIAITDDFMHALSRAEKFPLVDPHTQKVVKEVDSVKLFDKMCKAAWEIGEPGFFFIDITNKAHAVEGLIESTNPCGEQPLLPYESCNLGSINLANMVRAKQIDWDKLVEMVEYAVRFLDDVIDVNYFPLKQIEDITKANRKIGLGIMGFHDMLIQMEIPYDSDEAMEYAEEIMERIQETAHQTSVELGQEKGPFTNVKNSTFKDQKHQPRNASVITIAPTGTIATIAGCSSGLEPHFALYYERNVMDKTFIVKNKYLDRVLSDYNIGWEDIKENKGTLKGLEIPDHIKAIFKTSHEISPKVHVEMQSTFQKYVDAAVSKTINMKNSATLIEVKDAVWLAYRLGCKGLTVYRDGSRQVQPLEISKPKERPAVLDSKTVKLKTGCGSIYVNVSFWEGKPFEVISNIGKAGGCPAAQQQSLCRVISMAFRSGIPPEVIIKQLRGIRCHKPMMGKQTILSCPDALGIALQLLSDVEVELEQPGGQCPDCGGQVVYEDGCERCIACTWTRCE